MKQIIVDTMPFVVRPQMVKESLSRHGRLIVTGPVQRANSENQNHRIYPKKILEREVSKYQQLIRERRSIGELDHPDASIVELKNASHILTELHWEGDDVIGTIEVLTTPAGNILKELFQCGVLVGISSRGLGTTEEIGEGRVQVGDDYEILCWDMVSNPSTQGSFVRPITESVNSNMPPLTPQQEQLIAVQNTFRNVDKLSREILTYLSN